VIKKLSARTSLKPADSYRLLSGLSDETLLGLMAKSKGDSVKRQVSAFLTTYQNVQPILTGEDLKAMGLKPGPQFKTMLNRLHEARLNGEVNTEAEEREIVRRMAGLSK
jgi:tRNA nucleotidyltransferase (CCA-adding enzyme)